MGKGWVGGKSSWGPELSMGAAENVKFRPSAGRYIEKREARR